MSIMSASKQTTKSADLIAAIQRKVSSVPDHPVPETPPTIDPETPARLEPQRSAAKVSAARPKLNRVGKPVQFWLHDEDRRLVRELSAWLAGQGERPTDSLVIRTALRIARSNAELLAAYRQVSQMDGRLKQHKKPAHESV